MSQNKVKNIRVLASNTYLSKSKNSKNQYCHKQNDYAAKQIMQNQKTNNLPQEYLYPTPHHIVNNRWYRQ